MAKPLTDFQIKNVMNETSREVEKRMKKAVQFLEAETKKLVSRGNRKGKNPSKGGEPPKVVSGTLRANIGHEVKVVSDKLVVGAVGVKKGPAEKYAKRLELGFTGTDSKGRKYNQQERPYLQASLKKNEKKLLKFFE